MPDIDIINDILSREGKFVNDPADHGGATNFGITAADLGRFRKLNRVATVAEVKTMQVKEAQEIYQDWYITAPGFNRIEDAFLKSVLVDTGVLHGTGTSIKWLQQTLGVTVDGVIGQQTINALTTAAASHVAAGILALRIRRYATIVKNDVSQLRFLEGWINRATSLLKNA